MGHITYDKLCEYCGVQFKAKKIDAQCCSDKCSKKKWYYDHQEEVSVKRRATYKANRAECIEKTKQYNAKLKQDALSYYSEGTMKCLHCGEDDLVVLCIDHINGNGNKHRREIGSKGSFHFYSWLKHNDYPEGYQVLCFNCNMRKRYDNKECVEVK